MESRSVVILVHGIRDFASWQYHIKKTLDQDFHVESTNYGRFDLLRFLLPIKFYRKKAAQEIWEQIRDIKLQYPGKKISIIAHSFGTHIIAEILRTEFDLTVDRVILCGSVLTYNFPFEDFSNRYTTPLLNEVGNKDPWPAIAQSITWGYGSAGTYGFHRPRVVDRWHANAGHGYFLDEQFCRDYWLPFLKDGTIVSGSDPASPPIFLEFIYVIRLKYIILSLALFLSLIITSHLMKETLCFPIVPPSGHPAMDQNSRECLPGRLSYLKWIDEAEYPAVDSTTGRWLNDRANRALTMVRIDEAGTPLWSEQNLLRVDGGRSYWQKLGDPGWTEIVSSSGAVVPNRTGTLLRRQDPNRICNPVTGKRTLLEAFIPDDAERKILVDRSDVKMCYRWAEFDCDEKTPLGIYNTSEKFSICVGRIFNLKKDKDWGLGWKFLDN